MTARYIGLNASTGQQLSDLDHIRQSIRKILTTPLRSRVMRREVGSLIPDLLDKPLNGKTRMQVMAATVMAISAWEPRVELARVQLQTGEEASELFVDLELTRRDGPAAGQSANLLVPLKG
ncbi:GPW/gp25 family protein [Chromobacterium alkanivorans]|uniref:GPW/gp25 family protein n=1 Tax=Chromobacterium alkanivorans TaxID=1071719 RepID=UPI0019682FC6|nr:GPW/gp25 family protein [Chromobacterium alkanivorans]MBN3005582.1 GPW/gp25 family protein [Chromobacterium alkanivorans]